MDEEVGRCSVQDIVVIRLTVKVTEHLPLNVEVNDEAREVFEGSLKIPMLMMGLDSAGISVLRAALL